MAAAGLNSEIELKIAGKPIPEHIKATFLGQNLHRTINGASTLTLTANDPERFLLQEGYFESSAIVEAKVDGLDFVACSFHKNADEFELTFEDREFFLLSQNKQPFKVTRKHGRTRAEFVERVVRAIVPHAKFFIPELHKQQPIEGPKGKAVKAHGKGSKHTNQVGVTSGDVKIQGSTPDPDQLSNINITLQVCEELDAPHNARLGIICAAIGESTFRTHDRNAETGADGCYQLLPSTAKDTGLSPFDTKRTAEHWLKTGYYNFGGGIKLANEGKSPGEIAEKVEGSGAGPGFYEAHKGNAEEILNAGGGGGGSSGSFKKQTEVPFLFEINGGKSEDENTLQGLERLAEEVKWRFFVSRGVVYYLSDESLRRQKPALELDEASPGVITIDWELDKKEQKRPSTCTINARADLWTPEVGKTVRFKKSMGKALREEKIDRLWTPVNWIVSEIERPDITDNGTTITLTRPQNAKAEKAQYRSAAHKAQVVATPGNPSGTIQNSADPSQLDTTSVAMRIYYQAKWIGEQGFYYQRGGGHGGFHATKYDLGGGTVIYGLDCSGAVSWALHSAGAWGLGHNKAGGPLDLVNRPLTSGELETWGDVGPGKYVTLWTNSEHCFLWIQIPSALRPEGGPKIDYALEASHTGATVPAPHGVGLRPRLAGYPNPGSEGFTARHWAGT